MLCFSVNIIVKLLTLKKHLSHGVVSCIVFRPNRPGTRRFGLLLQACRPPSSFCHLMRLRDFIDFISVKRGREDRRRDSSAVVNSCSQRLIPLSQLEASDRGAIAYSTFCQRRGVAIALICGSADPRIRKLISVNISTMIRDRDILSKED